MADLEQGTCLPYRLKSDDTTKLGDLPSAETHVDLVHYQEGAEDKIRDQQGGAIADQGELTLVEIDAWIDEVQLSPPAPCLNLLLMQWNTAVLT